MTATEFISALQLVTGASFFIGLILTILAYLNFRQSRSQSGYWRRRRQAGRRGFRYAVLSVFMLVTSLAICAVTIAVTFVEGDMPSTQTAEQAQPSDTPPIDDIEPTRTLIIVTSEAGAATREAEPLLPDPSATPSSIATTPQATLELNQTATLTLPSTEVSIPEVSMTPTVPTPPPTPVATVAGVIDIIALDDVVSDEWQPIQPATEFPIGTTRIYVFFDYADLEQNTQLIYTLLQGEVLLQEQQYQWGISAEEPQSLFFFGNSNGFDVGAYTIRISTNNGQSIFAETAFTIVP